MARIAASVPSGSRAIALRTAYSSSPIRSSRPAQTRRAGARNPPAAAAPRVCTKVRRFMVPCLLGLVVDADIVHDHLLRERRRSVWIAGPAAADRDVEQQEEGMIEHPVGSSG